MQIFSAQVSDNQDKSPYLSNSVNDGEGKNQEPTSADLKESDQISVDLDDVENLIKKETKRVKFDGEDLVVA